MNTQTDKNEDFFFGVMILKDGKWTPNKKYDKDSFGSALIYAEELDSTPGHDGVKIMRVPTSSANGEPKEAWVSQRIQARIKAQQAAQVRAGAKQTKEQLAAARRQEHMKK